MKNGLWSITEICSLRWWRVGVKNFIYLSITILSFLNHSVLAGKIPLHITNDYYEFDTILQGEIVYKKEKKKDAPNTDLGENKEEFTIPIKSKYYKKDYPINAIEIEGKNIESFAFALMRPENIDNEDATLLAVGTFKPAISLLSLSIKLIKDSIECDPKYNLPPATQWR